MVVCACLFGPLLVLTYRRMVQQMRTLRIRYQPSRAQLLWAYLLLMTLVLQTPLKLDVQKVTDKTNRGPGCVIGSCHLHQPHQTPPAPLHNNHFIHLGLEPPGLLPPALPRLHHRLLSRHGHPLRGALRGFRTFSLPFINCIRPSHSFVPFDLHLSSSPSSPSTASPSSHGAPRWPSASRTCRRLSTKFFSFGCNTSCSVRPHMLVK